MFLDTRPSQPNRALQMETQYVPSVQSVEREGQTYARIAPTSFPPGPEGDSVVVHRVTSYSKKALWDAVKPGLTAGHRPAVPSIRWQVACTLPGRGGATWKIYPLAVPREDKVRLAWSSFATPMAPDPSTFGFRWNDQLVTKNETRDGPLVTLPEYFRLVNEHNDKAEWVVVRPEDVPAETGLAEVRFTRPIEDPPSPTSLPTMRRVAGRSLAPWQGLSRRIRGTAAR